MDKKIRQLITRIKNHLIKLNGEKIKKSLLYGSYAWGEATKDSDNNGKSDRVWEPGAEHNKAKFGFKNKSEAIKLIIQTYEGEFPEPELRPEFIEKMGGGRKNR